MNLTFFAQPPYLHEGKNRLMGGSALIRGEQIAKYLGAKYNPVSGYENDICVYIKPEMKRDATPSHPFAEKSYIDVIDYKEYIQWLRDNPALRGIVASQYSYDILKKYKLPNKIVFIPQQHCNFERMVRDRKIIKNVGIIGAPRTFQYSIDELSDRLKEIGLTLITKYDFQTREDVVNFYKQIDIQLVWDTIYRLLKNPLKIINAGSFGIPTVGYPHKGYREVEGYYVRASTVDQLVNEAEKLINLENYEIASKDLLQMAEKYHISRVAEMYKLL